MLKTKLIHPEILSALAKAGHGSQVLIADGNYPVATATNPLAARVYLNLAPGLVSATDVLRVLVEAIPIEGAAVMEPKSGRAPAILREFRSLLPKGTPIESVTRVIFYEAARREDTALVIATGEQRLFANILLTIGVVASS
jgi:L-fucose mutarotase